MPDEVITAILTMLVDLKAENLALWKILDKAGQLPRNLPPQEMAEANQMLQSVRAGLSSLPKTDPKQISILLAALSRTQIR